MKLKYLTPAFVLTISIVGATAYFSTNNSVKISKTQDGTFLLVNTLRTAPDFAMDTQRASAIIRGKVISIETLDTPISGRSTRIIIGITGQVKGLDGAKTVEVLAYNKNPSIRVEDSEIPDVSIGDTGVFYLDWIPAQTGFYEFFGGSRGALVDRGGFVQGWNDAQVSTETLISRIQESLSASTNTAKPQTLGEQLRDAGYTQ